MTGQLLFRACAVLCGLLLVCTLGACDSTDEQDANFQLLTGTWTVTELRVEGSNLTSLVDQQYDDGGLTLALEGSESGERRYRLTGRSEGRIVLDREGPVDVFSGNVFAFVGGFGDTAVIWTFDILSSSTVDLRSDAGTATFLRAVLPGLEFGVNPLTELRIERLD